jgi:hypothetical protein
MVIHLLRNVAIMVGIVLYFRLGLYLTAPGCPVWFMGGLLWIGVPLVAYTAYLLECN